MTQASSQEEFDWVTAQSTCNAAAFFDRLKAGVKNDVQRRNSLPGRNARVAFEFFEDEDGQFEVTRAVGSASGSGRIEGVVRFQRRGRRIEVSGEDIDVLLTGVMTLDPEGHCRVVVGEAMYAEWEFRRMALEQLFFLDDEQDVEDDDDQ
jgi:hypothetical protein